MSKIAPIVQLVGCSERIWPSRVAALANATAPVGRFFLSSPSSFYSLSLEFLSSWFFVAFPTSWWRSHPVQKNQYHVVFCMLDTLGGMLLSSLILFTFSFDIYEWEVHSLDANCCQLFLEVSKPIAQWFDLRIILLDDGENTKNTWLWTPVAYFARKRRRCQNLGLKLNILLFQIPRNKPLSSWEENTRFAGAATATFSRTSRVSVSLGELVDLRSKLFSIRDIWFPANLQQL